MKIDKNLVVHRSSTIVLRLAIVSIGAIVLAICVIALPAGIASDKTGYYRPLLAGLYVPAIPFFFALLQSLKLLDYIDKSKAFSELSVSALKNIKYCGVTIGLLFMTGLPYIYYAAERDDAPGVLALALVIIGASFVVAVFAALMQRLLMDALQLKSENDLTV